MNKSSALSIALFAITLISHPVLADDNIYELQYLFVDSDLEGVGIEPNALQFKYIKPYSDHIDFEGIVVFGINEPKVKRKIPSAGNFTQKFKLSNVVGVLGKIHTELEPRVWLYGHLGLARIEYNISSSVSGVSPDGTINDIGAVYGLGLSFAIFKKGAFVFEYNQFPDITEGSNTMDTSAISLGYQVPF